MRGCEINVVVDDDKWEGSVTVQERMCKDRMRRNLQISAGMQV